MQVQKHAAGKFRIAIKISLSSRTALLKCQLYTCTVVLATTVLM